MKNILLFAGFFSTVILQAQTTITKTFNDPNIGDSVTNVLLNGNIDNSGTGQNATFSNPTVTAGANSVNTYSAPTAAEITSYPGSTIKHSDGSGTNIFYKQNSNMLEITGIVNPQGSMAYSNNATAIVYPASYGGTVNTDQAAGTVLYGTTTAYFKGPVTSNVDAAGTLIIGSQTYSNVIRLKIFQNFTLYYDPTFFLNIGTLQNTMYLYFDATHKFPLLTSTSISINVPSASINQNGEAAQAQSFIFLGNKEIKELGNFSFYPNPSKDFIQIQSKNNKNGRVKILSANGNFVSNSKLENGIISVKNLTKGIYFAEVVYEDGAKHSFKFVKE